MVHLGVLGVGAMGRNHARVYSELKSVDSVFIFDTNQDLAKEVAKASNVSMCTSIDELASLVDAVSICVPTPYHFAMAKKFIEYGINIFIEKPICQTVQDAQQLVEMIPRDIIAGVGHIERFNPVVHEIFRIINKPLYVEIKRHNPASARVSGSTVIEDLMIHDIDIVFNLLFNGTWTLSSAGTQDICAALFNVDNIPVFLSASRKASKKIRSIYIEEEEFTVEGDLMTQEIFVYRKPNRYGVENARYIQDNIIEKVLVNKVEPLKSELSTFVNCIRDNRQFPITPRQALKNLEICEYIRKQANIGDFTSKDPMPMQNIGQGTSTG